MKKIVFLIMAALICITEGYVIGQNMSYQYQPAGNGQDIFGKYMTELSGYHYEEEAQTFEQIDADPNFYLQGMTDSCGGIKIVLQEPAQEEILVQVFYAEKPEKGLSERRSVKTKIPMGEDSCHIKLPLKKYEVLRIDMDASFRLKEIISYDAAMKKIPVINREIIQKALMAFPVIFIFYALLLYAHLQQKKDMGWKAYAATVLAGSVSSKKRAVYIDYLRVFAAAMIIISHSVSNEMAATAEGSLARFAFVAIFTLGVCCNDMYVMISGHLLLSPSQKEMKLSEFYCRRVAKVVIPLMAYYLFLLYLNHEISFFPPKNLGYACKSMLSGAPDAAPHFWLLYTFVALYIATPVFKAGIAHLSDETLFGLSIVILVMNALTTYLPLAGILTGVSTFLAGWEGVFILGYIIQKDSFRKYDKVVCGIAILSYAISLMVVFRNYGAMNFVYNCATPTILTTCGIFAFVKSHLKWFSRDSFLLRMCSKYSFSILMIHWYTLFAVTEGMLHMSVMRGHIIGGLIATNVIAFLVSLAFAIVFDNTIVMIGNMLFDKAIGFFSRFRKAF